MRGTLGFNGSAARRGVYAGNWREQFFDNALLFEPRAALRFGGLHGGGGEGERERWISWIHLPLESRSMAAGATAGREGVAGEAASVPSHTSEAAGAMAAAVGRDGFAGEASSVPPRTSAQADAMAAGATAGREACVKSNAVGGWAEAPHAAGDSVATLPRRAASRPLSRHGPGRC